MPGTPPGRERLLAIDGVHTVRPRPGPDERVVELGVEPGTDRDALPTTAHVDGEHLRVTIGERPQPESLGRALRRAQAADRAAASGYHPHVPVEFLRRHVESNHPTRSDGGTGGSAARTPGSDAQEGVADARSGPRDAKQRPLASGLRIGPGDGTYGTLGPPVYVADLSRPDAQWDVGIMEGDILLATNRHVLRGSVGDPVYQPAVASSSNRIGELAGYVPLQDGTYADIAVIKLDPEEQITDYSYWELGNPDQNIQRSGYFDTIGSQVKLSAGNSGVLTGLLQDISVSVNTDYGGSIGTVTVNGTDETNDISQGGDSGSQRFNDPDDAMLDMNFASDGGLQDGGHAWGCRLDYVERELGVRFLRAKDVRNLTGNLETGTGAGYYAQNGAYYAAGGAYTSPAGGESVTTVTSDPDPPPGGGGGGGPETSGPTGTGTDAQTNEQSFPAGSAFRGATRYSLQNDRQWTLVNAANAGVPNDGTGDAAADLQGLIDAYGSNTIYQLDAGTYRWDSSVLVDVDNVAIIGNPDQAPPTLSITAGHSGGTPDSDMIGTDAAGVSGFILRDLEYDISGSGNGGCCIRAFIDGQGGYVKDVDIHGQMDPPTEIVATRVDVGAVLSCHGLQIHDGGQRSSGVPSAEDTVGIILTGASKGDLHLGQCRVAGCPNNGVYASGPRGQGNDGRVVVRGGLFYNSDRDQLRGGNESEFRYAHCFSDSTEFTSLVGIWCRRARGVTISDCLIEQGTTDGAPAIDVGSTSGAVSIQDTTVRLQNSNSVARALAVVGPDGSVPGAGDVSVSNLTATGAGGDPLMAQLAGRQVDIADSCFYSTNSGADGIRYENGATGAVTNTNVNVAGDPIQGASSTSGITYGGTCGL